MNRNKLVINCRCRISSINSIILMKGLETSPTKAMMFQKKGAAISSEMLTATVWLPSWKLMPTGHRNNEIHLEHLVPNRSQYSNS